MEADYTSEQKDSLYYLWEKFLALHIYILRKVFLGLSLTLLEVARQVSNLFGFHYSGDVSDREAWKWKPHRFIPLYRAYAGIEKVNK